MIDRGRWIVDVITVEPKEQIWNEDLATSHEAHRSTRKEIITKR
jgi:hypothetical protein